MKKLISSGCFVLCSFLFISCGSSRNVLDNPTANATLWMQNSAEYKAVTSQIYQTASRNLGLELEDSCWTAIKEQKKRNYQDLPPAVILDIDETVLDNSPFQVRMIRQHLDFNPEQWNKWVKEAKAEAIPGALSFTKLADKKGVAVFYVTNRNVGVEEATRKNLQELGFPLTNDRDEILSKNERTNWTSDKTSRRNYLANRYRILMLFGDDLNDFISAKGISEDQRRNFVEANRKKWGYQWFIFPNPVYGSWEQALYGFDGSLSPKQVTVKKINELDAKTP